MNLQPVKPMLADTVIVYYVICRGCVGTGRNSTTLAAEAWTDTDDKPGAYYCPACAKRLRGPRSKANQP